MREKSAKQQPKKKTKKKASAKKAHAAAAPKKKRAAGTPKAKTKAKTKTKAKPKPKVKPKAKAKTKTKAKTAAVAAKKKKATTPRATARRAAASPRRSAPRAGPVSEPRPSERAMAVAAQLPQERPLTDEEREAMTKVAQTALGALEVADPPEAGGARRSRSADVDARPQAGGARRSQTADVGGKPEVIVSRIGGFVDDVRTGRLPEPKSQDVRLGLGVLWGEQVRAQVGWRWVHLSYPNGFASYALVPDDRAFACFPLNRLAELMASGGNGVNTSIPLFDSIRDGLLPTRRANAYLVIG